MAPAKPLSRKRLNLGEDEEDDDEQDTAASVTGSGLAASTSFKLQKTAKKRVNPFKTASASAKPRVSSLLPPQPPPPPPSLPPPAAQAKKSASTQSPESTPTNTNEGEEEDDYLSMSLTTLPPASTSPETYTQRRLRLARESEARARAPSKTELAQQEKQRREEGLARSLLEDQNSKGYRMMKAMGWKGEGGLGKATHHQPPLKQPHQLPRGPILEPIALSIKEDRAGIGHLTSEKLKFRESLHCSGISPTTHPTPPPHESAESYRTRLRLDKQEKRAEAQFYSAQTILEGYPSNTSKDTTAAPRTVPLKSIPLLYRSLILHRESKDRQKRARYEFIESLSSATHSTSKPLNLPGYERDFEDKIVFGATQMVEDDGDLEEEDEELEEFNQLPFTERLDMIVNELRGKWKYCFWCKYQYASQGEMDESCPGLEEDSHG
ncbi:hypothetical protein EV426DRAFT_533064 [Tirmania nivea]|nr:hypothetical protein EV426DRAFT_533064 [Tirmania nivea]